MLTVTNSMTGKLEAWLSKVRFPEGVEGLLPKTQDVTSS